MIQVSCLSQSDGCPWYQTTHMSWTGFQMCLWYHTHSRVLNSTKNINFEINLSAFIYRITSYKLLSAPNCIFPQRVQVQICQPGRAKSTEQVHLKITRYTLNNAKKGLVPLSRTVRRCRSCKTINNIPFSLQLSLHHFSHAVLEFTQHLAYLPAAIMSELISVMLGTI